MYGKVIVVLLTLSVLSDTIGNVTSQPVQGSVDSAPDLASTALPPLLSAEDEEARTVLSEVEKLRKVAEILQAVGDSVIPILIDSTQKTQSAPKAWPILHTLKKDVDDMGSKTP